MRTRNYKTGERKTNLSVYIKSNHQRFNIR